MSHRIVIQAFTSQSAVVATTALLKGGFVAKKARISYAVQKGLPLVGQIDNYPLILEGHIDSSAIDVHVYSVTAGYGGTGPHAMVDILKAAGFEFDETDILTGIKKVGPSETISLVYTR